MQLSTVERLRNWLGSGSINVFGMPFAGKDTQSQHLATLLETKAIGGGDILRSYHDQTTIKKLMATGELFPSDFYFGIVLPFLSQPQLAGKPLILSSIGRMAGEEQTIMKATKAAGHPTKAVVFMKISKPVLWERFEASQQGGDRGVRHDDAEHILEVRLREFEHKTLPVIDYYRSQGLLLEVDGDADQEVVSGRILEALTNNLASNE